MTEAYFTPTANSLIWKVYSVRVALRKNARQLPVTVWIDPPLYTKTQNIIPPKYIPVVALTPEMAQSLIREKHPHLLIVNIKQS